MHLKSCLSRDSLIPLVIWALLSLLSLLVLDTYLIKTGYEFVDQWALSEAVAIQEGNLISSLSKSERFLISSKFIKGVQIVDPSSQGKNLDALAEFGTVRRLRHENIPNFPSPTVIKRIGLFDYLGFHRIESRTGLIAVFEIRPDFILNIFLAYSLSLGILLFAFFLTLRTVHQREAERRINLIRAALNDLSTSGKPGDLLIQECPSLINVWDGMHDLLKSYRMREVQAITNARMTQMAAQVSHDIRSPLASLLSVVHNAHHIEEQTRVQVRNAVNRIRDIANNLLAKNREEKMTPDPANPTEARANPEIDSVLSAEPKSTELLSALLDSSISQKRAQFSHRAAVEINFSGSHDASTAFSEIQPTEFHRILSNLINNSIEAFDQEGVVTVGLEVKETHLLVTVQDNGKGIPPEVLHRIGVQGATFGKKDGNGLGISHAKATIESWGGNLRIESLVDQGTTVTLEIPLAEKPSWFVDQISAPVGTTVVVADDDPSIHEVWDQRFSNAAHAGTIHLTHLHSPKDVLDWYRQNLHVDDVLLLCDYEFAESRETGIELIEMTGLADRAILVTSRWDEPNVRQRCQKLGLRLLPKLLAGMTPVHVTSTKTDQAPH